MNETNRLGILFYLILAIILLITLCLFGQSWMSNLARADETSKEEAEILIKQGKEKGIEGERAEREGRHDEAMILYREAASIYEEAQTLDESAFNYFDYLGLAGCYQKVDQYDKAIAVINNGIARMEDIGKDREAYLLQLDLASVYKELGIYKEALEIYENQRERGKNSIDWYQGIADLYEKMSDVENAKAIYLNAFDRLVFDEQLYSQSIDFLVRNNYLVDAEAITYKVIVAFQDEPYFLPTAYGNLLSIYEKQGRNSETLDWARLKLEEAEKKSKEYWEETSPAEEEFHSALTWLIVIGSLVFLVLVFTIIYLVLRYKKRKARNDLHQ